MSNVPGLESNGTHAKQEYFSPALPRPPLSSPAIQEFQAGDRVEAAYDGGLNYFSGQVIRVTDVGLYDIKYDDGDSEQNVHPQFIRALKELSRNGVVDDLAREPVPSNPVVQDRYLLPSSPTALRDKMLLGSAVWEETVELPAEGSPVEASVLPQQDTLTHPLHLFKKAESVRMVPSLQHKDFLIEPREDFLTILLYAGHRMPIRDLLSSDPYVKIKVGGLEFTSSYIPSNLEPVWDQLFCFALPEHFDKNSDCIVFEVWDYDMGMTHDFIGKTEEIQWANISEEELCLPIFHYETGDEPVRQGSLTLQILKGRVQGFTEENQGMHIESHFKEQVANPMITKKIQILSVGTRVEAYFAENKHTFLAKSSGLMMAFML